MTAFDGWNDAAEAATIAAQHFINRWNHTPTAEIDAELFFDFTTTRPQIGFDNHNQRTLEWPTNRFQCCVVREAHRDLIVLLGIEPHLRWRTFCEQIIDVARHFNASQIITMGALVSDVPHNRPVQVYGSTNDDYLERQLATLVRSDYQGPTGIVGVLTTLCRQAGIPTTSLWATVPNYVSSVPSPKAALALVKKASKLLQVPVFATDLELASETYVHQINELVAEDEDTSNYVTNLEEAWDNGSLPRPAPIVELNDDPKTLLAEVEQYLKDGPDI